MSVIVDPAAHTMRSIIGHAGARQYLIHAVEGNLLPHALLLTGPKGVGRASLAYALAKLINCPQGAPPDCNCRACRKIRAGSSPDFLLIEPQSASGQLTLMGWKPGKDDPNDLQYYRFVETAPVENPRKVLVFRHAERMNIALSNYLLKLIEEPPSCLVMIFLAPRPSDLLATVRSRCTPVSLSPVGYRELAEFAADAAPTLDADVRHLLVMLSEGRPGRFLELLEEDAHGEHARLAAEMNLFRDHGFLALFGVSRRLAEHALAADANERLRSTIDALFAWLRDAVLHLALEPAAAQRLALYRDVLPDLARFADHSDLESLVMACEYVAQAYEYVPRQTDRTYVLELLLTRIGRALRSR
jgi:hypothetical protein